MSDYADIQISMALTADAPADLAEQVMMIVGRRNGMRTDDAERISLGESIGFPSMTLPDGLDGATVVDGRLHLDAQACNPQRPREDHGERTDLLRLVELLDRFCAEPVGAVVGAVAGDWHSDDAGPMVVTGQGIAILVSGYDRRIDHHGWWTPEPERFTVTSISPAVAARLTRNSEPGWGGGWGEYSGEDLAEIVAWAREHASA
jgi:hypothetical protein